MPISARHRIISIIYSPYVLAICVAIACASSMARYIVVLSSSAIIVLPPRLIVATNGIAGVMCMLIPHPKKAAQTKLLPIYTAQQIRKAPRIQAGIGHRLRVSQSKSRSAESNPVGRT